MADLGAIGVFRGLSQDITTGGELTGSVFLTNAGLSHRRLLPVWAADITSDPALYEIAVNGSISGIVKVNGVAVADRLVRLYYRKHGNLIASIKTDATGTFTFIDLDPSDKYTVIAFDDITLAPDFNAKIFDILTPTT